ncbi:hypothetical protein TrLO_g12649 [Triparma laevis f. longispina]|uniref:Uncharacterized protein n=1 Tax=Triparma laevis f. longispina TaxID=1714387 RepID=A0A9W7CMX0_9STRA|nr:hypothetical protein TrLO_g12649 [Triparma laevis f. longispina]
MTFNENKQECECQESFVTEDDGKCTCRAGQTLVNGRCEESENGRFKPEENTKSCKVCDKELIHGALEAINGTGKTSSASCACGKGKFHDPRHPTHDTPEGVCRDCMDLNLPEGFSCDPVGLTLKALPLKDGYWRSSKQSDNIVKCEIDASCFRASPDENCRSHLLGVHGGLQQEYPSLIGVPFFLVLYRFGTVTQERRRSL